jgi:hypothetical protein
VVDELAFLLASLARTNAALRRQAAAGQLKAVLCEPESRNKRAWPMFEATSEKRH